MRIFVRRDLDLALHSELRAPSFKRPGFTLVELLVAAALSLAIMGIISVAFQKSVDTFRVLRSVSQMQERLKSAHMVLKRDLEADHFFGGNGLNGGTKLSQQRLDRSGWTASPEGFFCILQGPNSISEGSDADGLPSTRAVTHSLHFTAKLNRDAAITSSWREEDFFYASAPNGTNGTPNLAGQSSPNFARPSGTVFASRWAEVMYFLAPNGSTANGEPLFVLYRRQRLLLDGDAGPGSVNPNTAVTWGNSAPLFLEQNYPDISWGPNAQTTPGPLSGPRVNRPTDISVRANRTPMILPVNPKTMQPSAGSPTGNGPIWRGPTIGELTGNGPMTGDDILLADVLSFEVKANWTTGNASMPFEQPRPYAVPGPNPGSPPVIVNADWPYDFLPAQNNQNPRNPQQYNDAAYPVRTFDTWSTTDGGPQWNPLTNPNGVDWNNGTVNAGPGAGHGFNQPNFNGPGHSRPPLRIRINSLQIRIRVWDEAGQTARQITIIQDM